MKTGRFAHGRRKVAGEMNRTERLYAARLETLKAAGEVLWYKYEPFNIRLAAKAYYRVDFAVMVADGTLECHECKGSYIHNDAALLRVKVAAEALPVFRFVLAQWKDKAWTMTEYPTPPGRSE